MSCSRRLDWPSLSSILGCFPTCHHKESLKKQTLSLWPAGLTSGSLHAYTEVENPASILHCLQPCPPCYLRWSLFLELRPQESPSLPSNTEAPLWPELPCVWALLQCSVLFLHMGFRSMPPLSRAFMPAHLNSPHLPLLPAGLMSSLKPLELSEVAFMFIVLPLSQKQERFHHCFVPRIISGPEHGRSCWLNLAIDLKSSPATP